MGRYKITHGFVSQAFDDDGKCIGQSFTCGDECTWENDLGEPADEPTNAQYHCYDMLQPSEIDVDTILSKLKAACVGVASAHAGVETCDMPLWLDEVEKAIEEAKGL